MTPHLTQNASARAAHGLLTRPTKRHPHDSVALRARRALALVAGVGMVVWFVLDVTQPWLDGLVPGLKDGFQIDLKPAANPRPLQEQAGGQVAAPQGNLSLLTCACTFSNITDYEFRPPYAQLEAKKGAPPGQMSVPYVLEFCNASGMVDRRQVETAEGKYMTQALDELVLRLVQAPLAPPTTASQLSEDGWKAARFAEAWGESEPKNRGLTHGSCCPRGRAGGPRLTPTFAHTRAHARTPRTQKAPSTSSQARASRSGSRPGGRRYHARQPVATCRRSSCRASKPSCASARSRSPWRRS
jgi:hypothetical protein